MMDPFFFYIILAFLFAIIVIYGMKGVDKE